MTKIFIDGQEGTTGLRILDRFANRKDIQILEIDAEKRKDTEERRRLINAADYVFLCLPDVAAIEAVKLVENDHVRIIDASTAHRTNPEFAYGFPELGIDFRDKIAGSSRVAVPGCYASGFISLAFPLVKYGIASADYPFAVNAVSGYSGGGKKMIAQYEDKGRSDEYDSQRLYALTQHHKHLAEMKKIVGLQYEPVFSPSVGDYYNGMVVSVPIHTLLMNKKCTLSGLHEIFSQHYANQNFVKVMPMDTGMEFIGSNNLANTNNMEIYVLGNDERIMLCSRFDNLGKGASGAAVQCLNIMMGIDEREGLI